MSKVFKNTVLYSIGEISPKIISFLLLPVYTAYLSPADYGIISYINSVILFLFILGSLSLNSFALRYYFKRESALERKKLLGNVFLVILVANLFILLLSFMSVPQLLTTFKIQIPWDPFFRIAIIVNFLDSFSIIPLVYFRIRQEASKFIFLTLGKTFFQVVMMLYFIVYLKVGIIGYFYALLCTQIIFSIINVIIVNKNLVLKFNWREIKEGLKFSLPLLPGAIAYFVLSLFDRIILERNVSLSFIGIYNVSATIALALNVVIQSGYKAIEPEIFKRYGKDNFDDFIKRIQKIFFSLIYVSGLALSLFSQEVFYYFTSESFYEGYKLVPILVIGVVMTGQNVIYSGVLSSACMTKTIGVATVCGAIFSLTFNLLFIPYFGVYAAAISSACSFFLMNTILYLKMPLKNKSAMKENLCVLLMASFSITYLYVFAFNVSLYNIFVKLLIISGYAFFVFNLLKVDLLFFFRMRTL